MAVSVLNSNNWSSPHTITAVTNPVDILADDMELENAIAIDIPAIDKESTEIAGKIVKEMGELYYDEEWLAAHPRVKKRLDIEFDSLRSLIKLRKANEQAHDALLNGISSENSNTALYRALGEIQRTALSITKQIDEAVTKLEEILQQYQLSIEEIAPTQNEDEQDISATHRGSKSFIKEQIKMSK